MRELGDEGRAPRAIVLENVYGCLTSHQRRRISPPSPRPWRRAAIASARSSSTRRVSCRNRGRACFSSPSPTAKPPGPVADGPCGRVASRGAAPRPGELEPRSEARWLWWDPPEPAARASRISPTSSRRSRPASNGAPTRRREYLLSLMSDVNRAKVAAAQRAGSRVVGGVYRRTRPDDARRQAPARRGPLRRGRGLPAHARRRLLAPDDPGGRGRSASARACCRRARRRG